jgi:carbon monoxide dehydrogenase subunit G
VERFEEQRTASAPIETCWQVLTDPAEASAWVPFVSSATAEGEPGEGRQLYVRASLLGVSAEAEQVVDVWEPPFVYGWSGSHPFPAQLRVELEATGRDTTRIRAAVEADPFGFVPFARGLVHRTVRRQFAKSADNLVDLAEQRA